ncbi:MAG: serine/threonine-protein kinase [Limnospira sp. PMC 1240.20]|uniref:serine/threonine-protein kinase n=1 Tax=unclassified Limnospira TaxID=2642885 RepID=UPI000A4DC995|nr:MULTISPECIES: serine/threonine-protein kinase [unclassified Limnospira]MDT9192505.1 serine/threonine-protein kinase [Limnospira sp. PMC 1245.20]MDT9202784.1 serine/threonine-protein kinase [Limnospira sp. PMC 1243.20]MDT9208022.1 serine/threonine-protein kinase [Limnospira sp. PMC 1252.20]MDT9213114.1 serine/threonine-protein kinase [Limnospira sp. PMC 1256.20]MDT9219183.1 serine/threonine-protein kinase [Limnospira sp. PMC 1240.20]
MSQGKTMSLCFNPACRHENPKDIVSCERCGQSLKLGDRYRGLREIGSGGFGRTYLGIDESETNHPPCAIKQFFPLLTNDAKVSSRLFRREAQSLQVLNHPQIPKFLAYFSIDEQQYIIQEFIPGETLEQELAERGVFGESKIRDILNQILPILQYLHARNLIHRDVKPANIIRRQSDKLLFLVDFGASKLHTGTNLAKTGTSIGTAEFVAPEQLRGKAVFASDLYSLGVTCIYLLTNTSPFNLVDGDNHWVWRDWLGENAVSSQLAEVLDGLISPGLSNRYTSASAALKDLNQPRKAKNVYSRYLWFGSAIAASIALFSVLKTTQQSSKIEPTTSRNEPIIRPSNLEAIQSLSTYINLQNEAYLDTGKFIDQLSQLIAIPSHYFEVQVINNHGVQIAAIPRQSDSYGYVAVLWGGKISDADNQRQQNWQPKDPTDLGTFSLPSFRKTPSDYITRVNYCESIQTTTEPPLLSTVGESLPLSTDELPCPPGYAFSLGIIDAIAKLSATSYPTNVQ